MTTPALGRLRDCFPKARITLLATPLVARLCSPHPWVDEVLVYQRQGHHRGLSGRLRLTAELRRRRFDMAVLFPNSFDAALPPWLARIPRRIGFRNDGRGLLLNLGVPPLPKSGVTHQSRNYLTLLDQVGLTGRIRPQTLAVTAAEEAWCSETLQRAEIGPQDLFLGINPGATYGSAKRWYPERFAAVGDMLAQRWGVKVVITGGPDEAAIAEEIARTMTRPTLNLAGKTDVRQLLAIIKRCNFFITNDSGPMHLAAALKVPLVAIFGPTDHTTTYPLADHALVVRQNVDCSPCLKRVCPIDHRCMTRVTPEQVVLAAEKLRQQVEAPRSELNRTL